MWYNNILEAVGNTPLIQLNTINAHLKPTVLAKVEYFNPGNSIKDRIAIKMIEDAERLGKIKPGGTIVEGTSGNTGLGLALVAAVRGYRCIFTITDKQSQSKVDILRALGAEVIVCPTNVAPEDPQSYYSVARRLSQEIPNAYYPNQYDNMSNQEAHVLSTGPEIWEQSKGKITHLVAGMGTCGTISGVSRYLKSQNPAIQVIGVDTYGSLFQKHHQTGQIDESEVYPYLTEGIGEDFLPQNYDPKLIDRIIKVSDKDAAITTRRVARLEGLFIGWSCGSAVHGALEVAKDLNHNDVLVVILPDHGTRYLGKVYNDEWMKETGFLADNSLISAQDIINRRAESKSLQSVQAQHSIDEAILVMRKHDISQLPIMNGQQVVGSVNESRLLNALVDDPALRLAPVQTIMGDPFPFVLPTTRIDVISKIFAGGTGAVMVQSNSEGLQIITKSDLIGVLTNA
jgi:cystathionine beta-synthase